MKKNKFLGRLITAGVSLSVVMSFVIVLPALADSKGGHRGRGSNGRGDDDKVNIELRERGNENKIKEHSESRRGNLPNNNVSSSARQTMREVNANVVFENKVGSAVFGTAKIDVFLTRDNLHDTRIKAKIQNLSAASTAVLEGWLVDNDSGRKLSLGGLKIKEVGKAELDFRQLLVNFRIYDKLVISEEPMNDVNPDQATVILEANINNVVNITPAPVILVTSFLNGANEVPATTSPATGFGVFVINTNNNTVNFHIAFNGLSSAETASHIHGPALAGANASVLFTLPLGSIKNGVWNYLESQEADILAGRTYVNVHSTTSPDGEIRGQITP